MYAKGCTAKCSMVTSCNRHGRCLGNGSCKCFPRWSGQDCSIFVPPEPCVKNMYNGECTAECSIEGTCNAHGRCLGNGACKCWDGWSGDDCSVADVLCAAGYLNFKPQILKHQPSTFNPQPSTLNPNPQPPNPNPQTLNRNPKTLNQP